MCGLAGMVRFDGRPVDRRLLEAMGEQIRHRGPDDDGLVIKGSVGLCHRRLAIIDLATGRQPMTDGDRTIVYNGEIYNYLELREELRTLGHRFRTDSDTEVLLKGYAEWGEAFVERLNGMFAFVLHDRARGRVLAARDPFGIKPLYYHLTDERLLYASEIKALLVDPSVERAVDEAGLADYLTFQFVLGSGTLFRGIRKLGPGEIQSVSIAGAEVATRRYWEPRFEIDYDHTEAYFVAELKRLLADAVRLQLRSDVPVGTYLSGGLDSGLVTELAAPMLEGRLQSFTGAFDEGAEFDERRFAELVARDAGATMHQIVPTERDFVELLPRLVYQMDEPAAGPGLFPQYLVSRRAAQSVKVCLGGQGGDEIFGGYARYLVAYLEQALKGAIFETNEEREHIVSLRSIVPHLASLRQYVPMLTEFWREDLFEPMDRRYFRLIDRSGGVLRLATGDFREAYQREAVFGRFQGVFNHPDTLSYYNKMTHFDMVTSLPALLHVEDRASMASSLESRVPLLDRRIVELITRMPPRMKFKGGELKYILKKAARGVLPKAIIDRKEKMGFPVPLHLWSRGACQAFFTDVLTSRAARERGLFSPTAVSRALTSEAAFGRRLWGLVNLELWHCLYVDVPPAPPPAPLEARIGLPPATRSTRKRCRLDSRTAR